jgi:hypothetical protein
MKPTHIPIRDWNWAPGTIPNPFIWLSDPITLTQAGEWNIVADFTRDKQVVISIDVTFKVVPESIIGSCRCSSRSISSISIQAKEEEQRSIK